MSPQPATPPKPAETAETADEQTLTDELIERIGAIPADERDIPEVQFMRAVELERTKAKLMKQVDANRQFLRVMDQSEALDEDLSEWLEVFYPTKVKDSSRSKDEVATTRKNHEAAAKPVKS